MARFTRYKYRYQGFLNGAPDGDHCIEPGAIGKIALQAMLLHPGKDQTLNVLNAWPSTWNARFKLWGPKKTWVAGQVTGNTLNSLTVGPATRVGDVLVKGAAPAGVTVMGSDDPGGFVDGGAVVTPMDPPVVGGSASAGGNSSGGALTNGGGTPNGGGSANAGGAGVSHGGDQGATTPGAGTSTSAAGASGASSPGGCSCRAVGEPATLPAWGALGLALGAALRRSRRSAP